MLNSQAPSTSIDVSNSIHTFETGTCYSALLDQKWGCSSTCLFNPQQSQRGSCAPRRSLNCATKKSLQACTETRQFKDEEVGEERKGEHWRNGFLSQILSVTLFHMQLFGCIDTAKALYHEGKISRVTSAGFSGEKKACDATS